MSYPKTFEDFTQVQKEVIFKRDKYQCVFCGLGKREGIEIQASHILRGESTIKNGETLCAQHNFQKKNYKQTESGKRFFIRLYELAKSKGDKGLQEFCAQILEVYEKNDVNGHIVWKK